MKSARTSRVPTRLYITSRTRQQFFSFVRKKPTRAAGQDIEVDKLVSGLHNQEP